MNLSFKWPKDALVAALAMGAELETRRKIKHPAMDWVDASGRFPCWVMEKYPVLMESGSVADLKPPYRPGKVYPLGFPHQVWLDGQVYIPCQERIVNPNGNTYTGVKWVGWKTPTRAGYVLPEVFAPVSGAPGCLDGGGAAADA